MTKKLFSNGFSKHVLVPFHAVVLLAMISYSASAQTAITAGEAGVQRVFANNFYGVGFGASFVSGMGLTLKDHFAYSPVSFVVTGMPFKIGDFQMYNIGGELQYDLYLAETRLYLVAGAGYYYYNDGSNTTDNTHGVSNNNSNGFNTTTNNSTSNELSSPFRAGFGLGYEMPFGRNVGMSLNLTFTAFMPSGDIIPTPSIGFIGYFR
ncbi:MAG TPA: hypothetical protein VGM92_10720 [Candidatus Kapabacteria bacterium]|jgi:hypothetical protein